MRPSRTTSRGSRHGSSGSARRAVSHTFSPCTSALCCRQRKTSPRSRKYQPLPTMPCSDGGRPVRIVDCTVHVTAGQDGAELGPESVATQRRDVRHVLEQPRRQADDVEDEQPVLHVPPPPVRARAAARASTRARARARPPARRRPSAGGPAAAPSRCTSRPRGGACAALAPPTSACERRRQLGLRRLLAPGVHGHVEVDPPLARRRAGRRRSPRRGRRRRRRRRSGARGSGGGSAARRSAASVSADSRRARLRHPQRARHLRLHDRHAGGAERRDRRHRAPRTGPRGGRRRGRRRPTPDRRRAAPPLPGRSSRRCSPAPARARRGCARPVSSASARERLGQPLEVARAPRRAPARPTACATPSGSVEIVPSSASSGSSAPSTRARSSVYPSRASVRPVRHVDVALDDRRVEAAVREAVQRHHLEAVRGRAPRAAARARRVVAHEPGGRLGRDPEPDAEHADAERPSGRGRRSAPSCATMPSTSSAGCTFVQYARWTMLPSGWRKRISCLRALAPEHGAAREGLR